jgi:hypothetical protein
MTKWLLGIAAAGVGSAALAQGPINPYPTPPAPPPAWTTPYQPPVPGVGAWPGFGTARAGPTVSPYLGLLFGRNLGVNYYLGTRPAQQAFATPGFGVSPFPVGGMSQLRTGFLPAAGVPTQEPVVLPEAGQEFEKLPPFSHPVTFGGPGRYAPAGAAAAPRPGFGPRPPAPYTRPRTGSIPRIP